MKQPSPPRATRGGPDLRDPITGERKRQLGFDDVRPVEVDPQTWEAKPLISRVTGRPITTRSEGLEHNRDLLWHYLNDPELSTREGWERYRADPTLFIDPEWSKPHPNGIGFPPDDIDPSDEGWNRY